MPYQTITPMLEKWFSKSLTKLPRELRAVATFHIPRWADLSAGERRNRAEEIDRQQATKFRIKCEQVNRAHSRARNEPQQQRDQIINWYNETLDADLFWKMPDVDPKVAATILCGQNPLDPKVSPDTTTTGDGESTPEDYRRLLAFFQSVAATDKQARTLVQWRDIARENALKCHSWIDEYALTMPSEDGGEAAPAPTVGNGETIVGEQKAVREDGEPYMQKGKNSREAVKKWVAWQAKFMVKDGDTVDKLAEQIKELAERNGYESERGKLTAASITRMTPSGLTGGRGKKAERSRNHPALEFGKSTTKGAKKK